MASPFSPPTNPAEGLEGAGIEQLLQQAEPDPYADHQKILELVKKRRDEAFSHHNIFERQWQRVLNYILNRQWIWWNPQRRQWVDKKLAKWVPKPVTNIVRTALISIRSMFADVQLNVLVKPVGQDPIAIQTASTASELAPILHEEHDMDLQMNRADFWFISCGNTWLHVWWDKAPMHGITTVPFLDCRECLAVTNPLETEIDPKNPVCPECGSPEITPSETQATEVPTGKGVTEVVSPFEISGPTSMHEPEKWPFIVRKRWRDKEYYVDNYPDLAPKLQFEKMPSDRGLQIFKSLAVQNDIDPGNINREFATGESFVSEGLEEYELWVKPNREFPKGLVARVVGAGDGQLLVDPKQGLPGPLPYVDVKGNPLFPFVHAGFEEYGGRSMASGALDPLIQKQDEINQMRSLIQLSTQRMANPVWLEPKGAEVEKFTGEPGLVVKWNPLGPGGLGKPERLEGVNVPSSVFQVIELANREGEELVGTFDVVQGDKPAGVEAFSAIQALIERSQGRFKTAFQQRGRLYKQWFALALELERQFGPEERIESVMGPNQAWTFKNFEKAQLQGNVSIQVEDGSDVPKTTLGMRAAIDQALEKGLLNPLDPDERMAMLENFGLQRLAPALDSDVKSAMQEQDSFEQWIAAGGQGPPPWNVEIWHEHNVHFQEHRKWANSDRVREMISALGPDGDFIRQMVTEHLSIHQFTIAQAQAPLPGEEEGGADGGDLSNSNAESGQASDVPKGSNPGPNQGPA